MQQQRLHAKYVAGILKEAAIQLKRLPNLNQASTAISKQITICGDLHGKLDDLLVIFHKVTIVFSFYCMRFYDLYHSGHCKVLRTLQAQDIFLWFLAFTCGNSNDLLCGLVVRVPGYKSRGPGLDSRRCQTF
jgi:hypothetical protein